MCHQSVGLVQSIIEKRGIPTVSITLLAEVTRRVRPPRALAVDRPLGYPLGEPGNAMLQKEIIKAALHLLHQPVSEPLSLSSERFHLFTSAWPDPKTRLLCKQNSFAVDQSTCGRYGKWNQKVEEYLGSQARSQISWTYFSLSPSRF